MPVGEEAAVEAVHRAGEQLRPYIYIYIYIYIHIDIYIYI